MHIITPYDPWSPKKKKTWQEELWEQQQIAEIEAQMLREASSKTLPPTSPHTSVASAGPMVNAMAGAGGRPPVQFYAQRSSNINFSGTPTTGNAPLTVQFANQSDSDALQFDTWTWDFGDGQTSTQKHPSHVYANIGSYAVQLTGSTPVGGVQTGLSRTGFVSASIAAMPITVAFTPLQTTGSIPFTVAFANTTPNYTNTASNLYKWTFSAGTQPITTSTVINPSVTFTTTGSWNIKLEATGSWNLSGSTGVLFAVSASN